MNHCDTYIIPALLSGLPDDCRNVTACTSTTCFGLKKNKIRECVFTAGVSLSKKLAETSCRIVDSFNTYQQGIDYNNSIYQ